MRDFPIFTPIYKTKTKCGFQNLADKTNGTQNLMPTWEPKPKKQYVIVAPTKKLRIPTLTDRAATVRKPHVSHQYVTPCNTHCFDFPLRKNLAYAN
ncbi:MAG: hypothetical protein KDC90_20050, partial [Ignavibacteriae bacterium]|nr:hypothetical protein [Ignavibacteriota bacterium]